MLTVVGVVDLDWQLHVEVVIRGGKLLGRLKELRGILYIRDGNGKKRIKSSEVRTPLPNEWDAMAMQGCG